MTNQDLTPSDELMRRVQEADADAVAEVFLYYRERLLRMVRLRLDRRLQGRVDASDVIQEAFLDIAPRAAEYAAKPEMPFYLWMRMVTGERLLKVHREHLQTQMRDVAHEVSIFGGMMPQADSVSLAGQFLGNMTTPGAAVMRNELRNHLQKVLDAMDPIDREIIALRHFEELGNVEIALILNLSKTAASSRYLRAIKRLKDELAQFPGFH